MTDITPPACAASLEAQARHVHTPCGDGAIVWRLWGEGEPLVMLHGGSGSWTHWLRNIPAVVAAGRTACVPDLPGFGDSAVPPGGDDADAAVAPLVEGLRTVLGEEPHEIVGFSFGTLVAVLLAADHPERVQRMLLVGSPVVPLSRGRGVPLTPWSFSAPREQRAAAHRANLEAIMLHDPAAIDEDTIALHEYNAARDRLRRRRLVTTGAFGDALARLACPVWAVYGDRDVLYDGRWDEVEAAWGRYPRLEQFVLFPQVGHWVQYEDADGFDALLAHWMAAG